MPNIFIAIWSYPFPALEFLCVSAALGVSEDVVLMQLLDCVGGFHILMLGYAHKHVVTVTGTFSGPRTLQGPAPLLGVSRSSCNLGPTSGKLTWGQLLSLRWLGKFREGCHTGLVGTHPALQHCWLALHLLHAAGHSTLLFGQTGKERQRWHLPHGDILYHCVLPQFLYSVPTIC